MPFDVPEGWAWCRLNALLNVCSSKRVLQSEWKKEGIPFYRAREIVKLSENGYVDNELFISEEYYRQLNAEYGVPKAGDLMVSGVGTIGKVYVVQKNDCFYYKDASVLCFENRTGAILSEYARYMLESEFIQRQMKEKSKGTTVDTITISTAMMYLCVLPPLKEQFRIISTVENSLKYVSSINDNKNDLMTLISHAKSKILDLAIRGKLVPQDPNDEPASVLLERIRAEKEELIKQGKIKRDKKESVIFKGDDNSYYIRSSDNKSYDVPMLFNLPNGWEWTTFPTISHIELGKTLDKAKNTGVFYPYIRSVNVQWGYVDLSDLKKMRFESKEIDRYTIKKDDLLICEGGDVGRCCIWDRTDSILYQNAIHRVRFYDSINCRFYMYLMMFFESKGILKRISNGVTIKHLTNTVLSSIIIPLPPISEQERIVGAIETLFEKLGQIVNSIS